jgi:hypothetical protein
MMRALILGVVLLVPGLSMAAQAPKPVHIDIDDGEVLIGKTLEADVGDISTRRGAQHSSLLRVRTSFGEKVLRSVSEL